MIKNHNLKAQFETNLCKNDYYNFQRNSMIFYKEDNPIKHWHLNNGFIKVTNNKMDGGCLYENFILGMNL